MEISPYLLAYMLFCALLTGIALGVLYDIFRIFRVMSATNNCSSADWKKSQNERSLPMPPLMRVFGASVRPFGYRLYDKKGKLHTIVCSMLLFFEDILFFMTAGAVISLLLYYTNDGQFRAMAVVVTLAGFLLYYFTIGKIVLKCSFIISFAIRALVTYIVLGVLTPFVYIGRLTGRIIKRILRVFYLKYYDKKIKKYTRTRMNELLKLSLKGFTEP